MTNISTALLFGIFSKDGETEGGKWLDSHKENLFGIFLLIQQQTYTSLIQGEPVEPHTSVIQCGRRSAAMRAVKMGERGAPVWQLSKFEG